MKMRSLLKFLFLPVIIKSSFLPIALAATPIADYLASHPNLQSQLHYYSEPEGDSEGPNLMACIPIEQDKSNSPNELQVVIHPLPESNQIAAGPTSLVIEHFNAAASGLLNKNNPYFIERFFQDQSENLYFSTIGNDSESVIFNEVEKLDPELAKNFAQSPSEEEAQIEKDAKIAAKEAEKILGGSTHPSNHPELQKKVPDSNKVKVGPIITEKESEIGNRLDLLLPHLKDKVTRTRTISAVGTTLGISGIVAGILGLAGILIGTAGTGVFGVSTLLTSGAILANVLSQHQNTIETCNRFRLLTQFDAELGETLDSELNTAWKKSLKKVSIGAAIASTKFVVGTVKAFTPNLPPDYLITLSCASLGLTAYSCGVNAEALYRVCKYGTEYNTNMTPVQMEAIILLEHDLKALYEEILNDKHNKIKKLVQLGAKLVTLPSTSEKEKEVILKNISHVCEAALPIYIKMKDDALKFDQTIQQLMGWMQEVNLAQHHHRAR